MASALCERLLPPLGEAQGIVGVHLCRTDDAISRVETAEKKARSEGTQIPRWFVLIEGVAATSVGRAAESLIGSFSDLGLDGFDRAIYRLECQRCKAAVGA